MWFNEQGENACKTIDATTAAFQFGAWFVTQLPDISNPATVVRHLLYWP